MDANDKAGRRPIRALSAAGLMLAGAAGALAPSAAAAQAEAQPIVPDATVTGTLSESDPELGQDVLERGMFLTGGGALLRGLDTRLSTECEVPVHLTDHPLQTVVLGAGKCLELMTQSAGLFGGSPWLQTR